MRWVCSDFLRDVCPSYIICVLVCDVYVTALWIKFQQVLFMYGMGADFPSDASHVYIICAAPW